MPDRRADVDEDGYAGDEDFVLYAAIVLWKRLMPERWSVEMIDDSIQKGYEYIKQNNYKDGLEKWTDAWTMIRGIVPSYITSVEEADEYLPEPLTQSTCNWSQDFGMELGNGGGDDISFHYLRIRYCSEFCAIFPDSDELILHNMSRAEAESYASLGYIMHVADNPFDEPVEKYPDNVRDMSAGATHICTTRAIVKTPPTTSTLMNGTGGGFPGAIPKRTSSVTDWNGLRKREPDRVRHKTRATLREAK